MPSSENAAGSEMGADGSESKKGRFTVKFAIGRLDSESAETAAPLTPPPPPSPAGKLWHLFLCLLVCLVLFAAYCW